MTTLARICTTVAILLFATGVFALDIETSLAADPEMFRIEGSLAAWLLAAAAGFAAAPLLEWLAKSATEIGEP